MRYVTLALAVLVVLIELPVFARDRTSFLYVLPFRSDPIEIIPAQTGERGRIHVARDAYVRATFCPAESDFVCFSSEFLNFAVPKTLDRTRNSWNYDGVAYRIEKTLDSFVLLGHEFKDLYLIKAPAPQTGLLGRDVEHVLFLYSPPCGILSIGFWKENVPGEQVFWLRGDIGFGVR